jgi:hypothetical protein
VNGKFDNSLRRPPWGTGICWFDWSALSVPTCLLSKGGRESKCDVVPHRVQGRSREWIGGLNRAKPRMALSTNTTVLRLDGDVPP